MNKNKPSTHPVTSQLEYEYILGPVKIKDGLFIGDEFAAKVLQYPPRTSSSSTPTR